MIIVGVFGRPGVHRETGMWNYRCQLLFIKKTREWQVRQEHAGVVIIQVPGIE